MEKSLLAEFETKYQNNREEGRRYSNSEKLYQEPLKAEPEKPEIPVSERKYPASPEMYEGQRKNGPRYPNSPEMHGNDIQQVPPGTQLIKNHLTGKPVLLQSGYPGEFGYKNVVANHSRELQYALIENKDLSSINISDGNFANSKMNGVSFRKLTAQGTNFDNSALHNVNFDGANLMNCSFRNVDLSRCTLRGANLKGCDLRNTVLPTKDMMEGADLTNAIMNDTE